MQAYVEVIIRTIAAFVLLMITSRILGKQTISNMTFHDFVSGITLGAIAANLAFNDKLNHCYFDYYRDHIDKPID